MAASPQLPFGWTIDPKKISLYLLNQNHPDGRSKAKFFVQWGFDPAFPDLLEAALVDHACSANLVSIDQSFPYGPRFLFVGPLRAPVGLSPDVLSVWEQIHGEALGKFITARPA